MNSNPEVFCMAVTPFSSDGALDERELRLHLERLIESGVSIYLGSPGSGEGHSLSDQELSRLYRLGVQISKGRVSVRANLREARNIEQLLASAAIAKDAGVDVIQIYTVDPGHAMVPTEAEQEVFYRSALEGIDHTIGLAVNLAAGGYSTPIGLLKRLCDDYGDKIVSINVLQPPTAYLAELVTSIGSKIKYYCSPDMLPEALSLGFDGSLTGHANVVPYTVRTIGKQFASGRVDRAGEAMSQLFRINRAMSKFGSSDGGPRWTGNQWGYRWLKPAMKLLNLPGHSNGYMRPPYLALSASQLNGLQDVMHDVDLSGWELRAREQF